MCWYYHRDPRLQTVFQPPAYRSHRNYTIAIARQSGFLVKPNLFSMNQAGFSNRTNSIRTHFPAISTKWTTSGPSCSRLRPSPVRNYLHPIRRHPCNNHLLHLLYQGVLIPRSANTLKTEKFHTFPLSFLKFHDIHDHFQTPMWLLQESHDSRHSQRKYQQTGNNLRKARCLYKIDTNTSHIFKTIISHITF